MADETKITLSEEELRVVNDTHWILTKHAVTNKIYELFNEQVPLIRKTFDRQNGLYPEKLAFALPKISRGENYRGLPYVMLDYPALFEKDQIFAVRTMLLWGNFISVTLLLSGGYKDMFSKGIRKHCIEFPTDLFICVHYDPWEHHFDNSNYVQLKSISEKELDLIFEEKNFLKLAIKIDLQQFNEIGSLMEAAYLKIISLLL